MFLVVLCATLVAVSGDRLAASLALPDRDLSSAQGIERIAFGSCSNTRRVQKLWPAISDTTPQAWLWTGDAVYANATDLEGLKTVLAEGANLPGYKKLLSKGDVIVDGVWDDHDMGFNDGGASSTDAADMALRRNAFLDFLGVPKDSPRRERNGLWSSMVLGEPGRKVKVIFLDTRSQRSDHVVPSVGQKRWVPLAPVVGAASRWLAAFVGLERSYKGQILGPDQWAWLEAQLSDSDAQFHIVVSSIQVLTSNPLFESWSHFPAEQKRLISLLQGTRGTVLLSGDVHHAEVIGPGDQGVPWEVTSSGMTHTCGTSRIYGWVCSRLVAAFSEHLHTPTSYNVSLNFGTLHFDFEKRPVAEMVVSVRGEDGNVMLEATVPSLPFESTAALERATFRFSWMTWGIVLCAIAVLVGGVTSLIVSLFMMAGAGTSTRKHDRSGTSALRPAAVAKRD